MASNVFKLMTRLTLDVHHVHQDSLPLTVIIALILMNVKQFVHAIQWFDAQIYHLDFDVIHVQLDLVDIILKDFTWKPLLITHFRDNNVRILTSVVTDQQDVETMQFAAILWALMNVSVQKDT